MERNTLILLCLFIFVVGCSKESRKDFTKLFPLRNSVIKEFDVKDVRVVIQNGNCIGISFVNSKYNGESETIQDEVRQRTLELISSAYPNNEKINTAWVAFVKHKRYFFVFNFTDSTNNKFYKKSPDGAWVNI
jgi:hypothetical protein